MNKNLFILILSFTLIGCGEGFEAVNKVLPTDIDGSSGNSTNNGSTNNEICAVQKLSANGLSHQSAFISQKLHLEQRDLFEVSAKLGEPTELVALINNDCMLEDASTLSAQIANPQDPRINQRLQAYSFEVAAGANAEEIESDLRGDECIIGATEQLSFSANLIPNDSSFNNQTHLPTINAPDAWDVFYDVNNGINRDIVIAIVDTGIDYNHPDLANVMWTDANGNYGRDFINNDDDPFDDHFHGTHVAGISAAEMNNNMGVAGVMGQRARLMAVKVLDADGGGSLQGIVNGILYAAQNGADIINLSLGANGASAMVQEALTQAVAAGSTVVVAAGNDGQELNANNIVIPASYARDIEGVISVASSDSANRTRSGFSNFSIEYVEVAAPGSSGGNGIVSTLPGNVVSARIQGQPIEGTSMASPVVAGAAGLTLGLFESRGATLSPALVEQMIMRGAVNVPALNTSVAGGRHIDLLNLANFSNTTTMPMISRQPTGVSATVGEAATFSIELAANDFASVQWQKDGEDIPGETEPTLTISSTRVEDDGIYRAKIDVLGLEVFSEAAELELFQTCP